MNGHGRLLAGGHVLALRIYKGVRWRPDLGRHRIRGLDEGVVTLRRLLLTVVRWRLLLRLGETQLGQQQKAENFLQNKR